MKELPKYFVIKQCDSPLFEKYIEWFNIKYGSSFFWDATWEYYWFDWKTTNKKNLEDFYNNPTVLTPEQWDSIINGVEEKEEYIVWKTYEFSNDWKTWIKQSLNWYCTFTWGIFKHIRPIKSNPEIDKAIELLEKEWYIISKN